MAILLAIGMLLVIALTVVPVVQMGAPPDSSYMPPLASAHGEIIDEQIHFTLWIVGGIFVISHLILAWFIWKYRQSDERKAVYLKGNDKLEFIWTPATLILFVGLNLMGQGVWADMHLRAKPSGEDVVHVEVNAQQFNWWYRFPGKDGVFAKTDVKRIDDATGNWTGVEEGCDDWYVNTLKVPVDTDVVLTLKSRDVLHNFACRELRIKQDTVPGLQVKIPFRAVKEGKYEVACSELCGAQHFAMSSTVEVVSKEAFKQWVATKDAEYAVE